MSGDDTIQNLTTNTVKIIKVLGEGGFSFVYLAQDETSGVSGLAHMLQGCYAYTVSSARICLEEDSLSYWIGRCEGGYARSRSISSV